MERLILSLLILLFSHAALAAGSISLEPSWDPARNRMHYAAGLSVSEELPFDKIQYKSWTGFGNDFQEQSNFHSWYVSKHQLDLRYVKDLIISPGAKLNYLDDQENGFKKRLFGEVFLKLSYQIW